MKKFLKRTVLLIGLLILGLVLYGWIASEPLPEGKTGQQADALAQKMLQALNQKAYADTRFLEWSYRNGANNYQWDKKSGSCIVWFDDKEVVLNLKNPEKSTVKETGKPIEGPAKEDLIEKALKNFNNDSFWLVAPYKVFDAGVVRKSVTLESGEDALLVTYTSGGSTPGDSYLWLLNDNGFPRAYKMWVKIIPIGGVEASWDSWLITESGAFLPKTHELGPLDLDMGQVKGYNE
ncbi:hypothetical protein ABV409_09100 [Flagellimonas sp. DF-77]|uniref:hypothetical protein n=1 Tax=Flagellimonas algarum TaxID=3230298 RepID=UPI003397BD82